MVYPREGRRRDGGDEETMNIQKAIQALKCENELMLFNPTTGEVGNKYRLTDLDRDFYEAHEFCVKMLKELEQYRQIGTVDECRAAREKMKPKKIIFNSEPDREYEDYICPSCKDILQQRRKGTTAILIYHFKHCPNYGQALDWTDSDGE